MILFSLLAESVFVIAVYTFFAFSRGPEKSHQRTLNIMVGFVPILIFQGAIAVFLQKT